MTLVGPSAASASVPANCAASGCVRWALDCAPRHGTAGQAATERRYGASSRSHRASPGLLQCANEPLRVRKLISWRNFDEIRIRSGAAA